MPLPLPAVPGSRIVHDLSGDELLAIATSGSLDNQTTTRDVANLAGGASNALLVESGSSKKISQLPSASHPLSVTNTQEGIPAVQVDGDDDLVDTFLTRGNLLGSPLTNITRTFLVVGMGPNSLVGHEYSTIMCEATGALTLQLGEVSAYDTEAQGANYTVVMVSEPGASVEILATADDNFNWGSNFSPNGGTLTTTQPGSSITISGNPDGFTWFVDSFEGTWTMTTTGSPVTFTSPSVGGEGSGNTITLTADTNIAAGSTVSVNSAGHAVQTWGPAPNVGGLVSLLTQLPTFETSSFLTIPMGSGAFVVSGSPQGATTTTQVFASISGITISPGTPLVSSASASAGIGLSGSLFVYFDGNSNDLIANTVSGGVISPGTPVPVSSATGTGASNGTPSFAALSATAFVFTYDTGGNTFVAAATVIGSAITLGSGVDLGSSGNFAIYALNSTSALIVYFDTTNNSYATAVVVTVAGTVATLHTPAFITGNAFNTPANPISAAILSSISFVLAWTNGPYQGFAAAGTISATTVSLGAPEYIGWGASQGQGGVVTSLALGSANAVFAPFGTTPTIAAVSGTSLTPTLGAPVDVSWFGNNSVSQGPVVPPGSNPSFPPIAVFSSTEFIWEDGQWSLREGNSSGLVSPPVAHQGLANYGLFPLTSTTVLAVIIDDNLSMSARVIGFNSPNASPPIGCSASAVTSGNPATITLSGACAGFTGLTPGAQYYANGDGSLTTANIGHPMGVATSTTQLTVIVK